MCFILSFETALHRTSRPPGNRPGLGCWGLLCWSCRLLRLTTLATTKFASTGFRPCLTSKLSFYMYYLVYILLRLYWWYILYYIQGNKPRPLLPNPDIRRDQFFRTAIWHHDTTYYCTSNCTYTQTAPCYPRIKIQIIQSVPQLGMILWQKPKRRIELGIAIGFKTYNLNHQCTWNILRDRTRFKVVKKRKKQIHITQTLGRDFNS